MKLKKTSLNWALAHMERYGDTDIFPAPFEFEVIRAQWSRVLPELEALDLSDYQAGETRRTLTPKSRYGFRLATQLHPIDSLLFAALVCEIAKDCERYRIPVGDSRVMSHRVKRDQDGQLYDPAFIFETFKERLRERCSGSPKGWVVVSDIADFYMRLYHHPLENALRSATTKNEHVDSIMRFLSQWNYSVSYGVPVGPAATRLLAEVAISDVDHALLDERIDFIRFSDDYRLFADSEREAFRSLAVLAGYLQENHGLTLSERKTDVMPVDRFVSRFLEGSRPGDSPHLADQIGQILERHSREEDMYAALEIDELPAELVAELDALDLNLVLTEQLSEHRMFDNFAASIALRRLAQLGDATLLDVIVDDIDRLTPVLPQVVNFFRRVTPADRRREVGARVLEKIRAGLSGHREYQRIWLLSLFIADPGWNSRDQLVALLGEVTDDISRPALLQALGTAGYAHWFSFRRRDVLSFGGWERRSFMRAAAACMSPDQCKHWLGSLLSRLDLLDAAVAKSCLASLG